MLTQYSITPENLHLEPIAIGIYSVIIYFLVSVFWTRQSIGNFIWILFLTGFTKHVSTYVLGLEDYFASFQFKRMYHNMSETELGKNPGGKEFRQRTEYVVIGALIEGGVFLIIGSGFYWGLKIKKEWNVFLTGAVGYMIAEKLGLKTVLCKRSVLVPWF
jgi:hypothetical protein